MVVPSAKPYFQPMLMFRIFFHAIIQELAKSGLSILLISSEFDELIHNSDRIVVLRDGRVIGELKGDERTQDNIMKMIAEHSRHKEWGGEMANDGHETSSAGV